MRDVRVAGLYKSFGSLIAVNNVSFEIKAGQFLTLLGPSGCGKTTTLRLIAGLEKPDAGSIYVGDRQVTCAERGLFVPPEKRSMGMVFQNYAIWPHMTVFQNIAFPLEEKKVPAKEARERVASIAEMVGLGALLNRPAPLLSGGQQQRVALARALISNPDVLLLDEPLSNLDARLREQMRFELREMQVRLGITTIFVTHDQMEAMTMSDHIIVMRAGCIEQQGGPRGVYETPETRFVMDFLGQVNHLTARCRCVCDGTYVACVETGDQGLQLPLEQPQLWNEGDEVLLSFRSEAVKIADAGGEQLTGTVQAAAYIGSHVEYVVQVGDSKIRVSGPPEQQLPLGTRVQLQVAPGSIRAWPKHITNGKL